MLGDYIGPGQSSYTKYDAAVTQKTTEWLATRAQELNSPWCLYVGLVAPHFPLIVPQEFYDLYPHEQLPIVRLHPDSGYEPHPWIKKQIEFTDSEATFSSAEERPAAMASYFGLCTWLDHNVGQRINTLHVNKLNDSTTVVYTSDHGDNLGARGLWGKSNMYQESCSIPLIVAGHDIKPGICKTPVSLLDLSVTIAGVFEKKIQSDDKHGEPSGKNLLEIATNKDDSDRVVFSEYHAAGSVSGAFMIRKEKWKYIYYVDYRPELFNLEIDPEELVDVASQPENSNTIRTVGYLRS